jgi:soluble lytic murein transglycosylase-like protein
MMPQQPAAPKEDEFLTKVMKDPWFRLGMALLEEGGPQPQPHSFGQDISRAVEKVQGQEDRSVLLDAERQRVARSQQMQDMARGALSGIMSPQSMQAPQAPRELQGPATAPPTALMPSPVGPRIDPVANPSSDIRLSFNVPQQFEPMLRRASQMYGIPYNILAAQAQHESAGTWDPNVKGQMGEIGIPQFMPKTARAYGLIGEDGTDRRNDPELAFNAQARLMRDNLGRAGGDMAKALHLYNASPGNPAGQRYARTVLRLAGMEGDAAGGVAPQAPQAPQAPAMPTGQLPQLPPELHKLFLHQAFVEGGEDAVKTVQAYHRLATQWQAEQFKQTRDLGNQFAVKGFESSLATGRDQEKARTEVANAGALATNKAIGEGLGKRYEDIRTAGAAAQVKIDRLNLLQDMLGRGFQGRGGETVAQLVRIGAALGFEGMDEKASAADVASSIISQMALSFRSTASGEGMPGAMSDADRQFLMNLPPGFEKTAGGNRILIEFYKRLAMRDQTVARMARAYKKKNGAFGDDFEDELYDYNMANPLFKPGELQQLMGVRPPPEAIRELQANPTPEMRQQFIDVFGKAALDAALKGGK